MSPEVLSLSSHKTLREAAAERLREAILSGELRPGERLFEVHLAERLGVSRPLLREILRELQQRGLVTYSSRRGVTVAEVSSEGIDEVYQMRAVLEGLAARLACELLTPEAHDRLAALHEEFKTAVSSNDRDRLSRTNRRFHDALNEACGRPFLLGVIEMLIEHSIRHRRAAPMAVRGASETLREHEAILRAIARRDSAGCERLVRGHIEAAGKASTSSIAQGASHGTTSAGPGL